MKRTLYFDMDGTIADLYGSDEWLHKIQMREQVFTDLEQMSWFEEAKELIKSLKFVGWNIEVITWLPMNASQEYKDLSIEGKMAWIDTNAKGIFDKINLVDYGTPKQIFADYGNISYLFDDNEEVRQEWEASTVGEAFDAKDMIRVLRMLVKSEAYRMVS